MTKEVKALKNKAFNSLILSIECFNRPRDDGRPEAVLIFLDHAFEMLLKASILYKGGRIRQKGQNQTIGFDQCVRQALSGADVFISNNDALTLQAINGLRDAVQHYILEISEQNLYIQAQAGLTLFREIHKRVFGRDLYPELPTRVLPLSTTPPADLDAVFDNEVKEVAKLLAPGKRNTYQANAKLRTLSIIDKALSGENQQPSDYEISKLAKKVKAGDTLDKLFPGVSAMSITAKGYGPSIDLRFTAKEGVPIHIVPEGTPGAQVVGIRKVNELDYYSLGTRGLAEKLNLTTPKTTAAVSVFGIKSDPEAYKTIVVGKTRFDRYSQKAIEILKVKLETKNIGAVWQEYQASK